MHVGKTTAGVNVTHQSMHAYINVHREIITYSYSTFLPAMASVSDFTHCHMMKLIH